MSCSAPQNSKGSIVILSSWSIFDTLHRLESHGAPKRVVSLAPMTFLFVLCTFTRPSISPTLDHPHGPTQFTSSAPPPPRFTASVVLLWLTTFSQHMHMYAWKLILETVRLRIFLLKMMINLKTIQSKTLPTHLTQRRPFPLPGCCRRQLHR